MIEERNIKRKGFLRLKSLEKKRRYFHTILKQIRSLISDVKEVKNELIEARNDINILKFEIRELKENNKSKDKRIGKKLIEREMVRIRKKHIEQEKVIIETGSMNDEFRKKDIIKNTRRRIRVTKIHRKTLEKLKEKKKIN